MTTNDPVNGHHTWSSDAATATISLEGIITGWSEAARRLLGYRAADVVGRAATDLLVTRERPGAAGLSLTATQEWSGTAALRHRDGRRVEVTLHAHPSLGGDGTAQGFLVAATTAPDESERDRRMVGWAFSQSSVALSVYTADSLSWQPEAEGGEATARTDDGFLRCVRRVAEEARPLRYERLAAAAVPSAGERSWAVELWPVRDPATGEVAGVGTATFDSSEQRSARERLVLLKEAGTRIGTTLNVTRTAEELAGLAVPRLAD